MQKKTKLPHTFKDNFWSKKRVESGYTIKELSVLLGLSDASVGQYFTGATMPKENTIRALCDFFDVNFVVGEREFISAHRVWDAERNRTLKYSAINSTPCEDLEYIDNSRDELLRLMYGKLSCDEFEMIYDALLNEDEDVLPLIYKKVDYDVFIKAKNLLKGTNYDTKRC